MAKSKSYGGLVVLALILAGAAGGGWYYFYGRADKQPEFSSVKVSRANVIQTISATGSLQTTSQVTISSQVSGNVLEINADFNDKVTEGQWLLKIDPSTYQQRLRQSQADLEAAKSNTTKTRGDTARTKDLFAKGLVSQADNDTAVAQLAQAESTLVSREAAAENAQTDLARCIIYSPIAGIVLNRTIDKGATVNVNQSAVALYTIINDLTKLQISADVSEADIGSVKENQPVQFSVDAYLTNRFQGTVSQVRNFAKNSSGVVTFSVIIDVDNSNLMLKPGMTATANIIIAERPNVLVVANNALRVRVPADLLPKTPATPAAPAAATAPVAAATEKTSTAMSDDERSAAMRDLFTTLMGSGGFQPGTPPTPDMLEKIKKLAVDKGLDPVAVMQQINNMGNRGKGGKNGGGGGGGRGNRGGGTGVASGVGMNISTQPRVVYKLASDATGKKFPEPITIHLGISDGTVTQVLDGLNEGDSLITYVTMPGATSVVAGPQGQSGNPFQQGGRGGGGPGGFGGGGRGF